MYTPITGTGSGTPPVVNITFDFISKNYVKASVDGVDVAFTWTGASQITFSAAVPSTSAWTVYRETPIADPLVDFTNGSVLTEFDLDLAQTQLRHYAQELDYLRAISVPPGGTTEFLRGDGSWGPGPAGPVGPAGDVARAADRAAMANIAGPVPGLIRVLGEDGRVGAFKFFSGDHSALVGMDVHQGLYVAPASDPTGASGAWVRQFSGMVSLAWFGPAADDTTDDGPILNSAIDVLELLTLTARGSNGLIYRGGYTLYIPRGHYFSGETLDPLLTLKIIGDGGLGWGAGTQIRFPTGVEGLHAQAWNTTGHDTVDGGPHMSGDALVIEDIYFVGGYAGTEADIHGIHAKRPVHLNRITVDGFQGDGVYLHASSGSLGADEGNVNVSRITDSLFTNNRSGISAQGADSNAMTFTGLSFISNRRWGIEDRSFLGNHNFGHHFDVNARTSANNGTTSYASYAWASGHVYFVIDGQETWATANAPSGTTADNTGWGYWYDQGAADPASGIPAWSAGMLWRSGGHILVSGFSNASSYHGTHVESNAVSQYDQMAMVLSFTGMSAFVSGGILVRNRARNLHPDNTGLVTDGNFRLGGDLVVGGLATMGGAAINSTLVGEFDFKVNDVANVKLFNVGADMYFDSIGGSHHFRVSGTDAVTMGNTGVNILGTGVLKVASTQVVGPRRTGWTADTGTAKKTANATYSGTAEATYTQATIQTLMNTVRDLSQTVKALKDELITHGLIGT